MVPYGYLLVFLILFKEDRSGSQAEGVRAQSKLLATVQMPSHVHFKKQTNDAQSHVQVRKAQTTRRSISNKSARAIAFLRTDWTKQTPRGYTKSDSGVTSTQQDLKTWKSTTQTYLFQPRSCYLAIPHHTLKWCNEPNMYAFHQEIQLLCCTPQ